jgi:AcrR family transcriptional regulator
VVQVKKKFVRQAILDSAYDLLSERGYNRTTLQDIADFAGTGVSSVYSYFPSKLHLLYAVVEPWYKEAFRRLEKKVRAAKTPRAKLRAILLGVWRDIPTENIQLANSLMEALATADPAQPKPVPLLKWTEEKLANMVAEALSSGGCRFDHEAISTVLIMAYDGFVINRRLNDLRDIERLSDAMCDILLGAWASSGRQASS